jgi:hypothetical protein
MNKRLSATLRSGSSLPIEFEHPVGCVAGAFFHDVYLVHTQLQAILEYFFTKSASPFVHLRSRIKLVSLERLKRRACSMRIRSERRSPFFRGWSDLSWKYWPAVDESPRGKNFNISGMAQWRD